jgi:glycosyltransferase involved in cell wall biosynthesis
MRKKPKILMISPGPKYNLDHAFRERTEYLSRNFSGSILTSGPSSTKEVFSLFEIHCVCDPFGKSLISTVAFLIFGLIKLVRSRLVDQKFDLIVTYDPLRTGIIGTILSFLTRTPLIVEVNGDYTNDWIYAEIESPIRRRLKKALMVLTEKFVLRRSDGIKLLYEGQISSFKVKENSIIKTFPNYVNVSRFRNFGESKQILFVGFPLKIKGLDVLIAAFKNISERYPEWSLKILGYYPDKTSLFKLIDGNEKINIHEPVDPYDMPEHMGRCGMFVLPSRTEAMGRVLVEAMAAGKARVGSRVGGIPTVIEDSVDGLLFQSENIHDLENKLAQLIEDEAYRNRLGANARQRYLNEFLPEHYFLSLNDFYNDVIKIN